MISLVIRAPITGLVSTKRAVVRSPRLSSSSTSQRELAGQPCGLGEPSSRSLVENGAQKKSPARYLRQGAIAGSSVTLRSSTQGAVWSGVSVRPPISISNLRMWPTSRSRVRLAPGAVMVWNFSVMSSPRTVASAFWLSAGRPLRLAPARTSG